MTVKTWNRLLNPLTNSQNNFDDVWILMMLYERARILKLFKFDYISAIEIIMKAYDDTWLLSKNGGGGIRTHGTLADTLVFKSSRFLVISIDLLPFKEQL